MRAFKPFGRLILFSGVLTEFALMSGCILLTDEPGPFFFADFKGKNGWIAGKYLFRTKDNGGTWDQAPIDVTLDSYDFPEVYLNDMEFLDSDVGYYCSSQGVIMKTEDGGNSWYCVPETAVSSLFFYNNLRGLALLRQGGMATTQDGGFNWRAVRNGLFTAAEWITEEIVFAANSSLFQSEDGGDTWAMVIGLPSSILRCKRFGNDLWLVGVKGLVVKYDLIRGTVTMTRVGEEVDGRWLGPDLRDMVYVNGKIVVIGRSVIVLIDPNDLEDWEIAKEGDFSLASIAISANRKLFAVGGKPAKIRFFPSYIGLVLVSEDLVNWSEVELSH